MIPEIGQVIAAREDTTASGNHHNAYVRITVGVRNALCQRLIHADVESVAFGDSVDRQNKDAGLNSLGAY